MDISSAASVNKDALNAQIQTATSLVNTDYTPESWAAMQSALATANTIQFKSNATQSEIDSAAAALDTAIKALVKAEATPPSTEDTPTP